MLNIIKNLVNKFKPDKKKTLKEKIEYLKTIDIDPYNKVFYITTFNNNIIDYIEDLEFILNSDLENTYPRFKKITPINIKQIYIMYFFSNNESFLTEPKLTFNKWLDLILDVIEIYEIAKSSIGKGYLYSNSLKIKPYILDIENIINTIYDNYIIISN